MAVEQQIHSINHWDYESIKDFKGVDEEGYYNFLHVTLPKMLREKWYVKHIMIDDKNSYLWCLVERHIPE